MPRPLPDDPIARGLVRQAQRAPLSRRTMLHGVGIGAAALALAACSSDPDGRPVPAADNSANDRSVSWANWPRSLDQDLQGNHPTLQRFEGQTGIAAEYRIDIDDSNAYYARIKDQLANGVDIGVDLVALRDWMTDRWIRLGYAQPIDASLVPNASRVQSELASPEFDPDRSYSMPWRSGIAGIFWNRDKIPNGLRAVSDLWLPAYKGRVGVLSEMRDTVGLIMLENGVDISSDFSNDDFAAGTDVLRRQVEVGQIRNIKGASYVSDLVNDNIIAGIGWSHDIASLAQTSGGKWAFAIPDAGGTLWTDNLVIPVGSFRAANAAAVIDYYYTPEVAAEVAAWTNHIAPIGGAREAAAAIDPELAENTLLFPDAATLSRVSRFRRLSPAEEQSFGAEFQSVLISA